LGEVHPCCFPSTHSFLHSRSQLQTQCYLTPISTFVLLSQFISLAANVHTALTVTEMQSRSTHLEYIFKVLIKTQADDGRSHVNSY